MLTDANLDGIDTTSYTLLIMACPEVYAADCSESVAAISSMRSRNSCVLRKRGLKKGLATLCIGGGEGTAMALELL